MRYRAVPSSILSLLLACACLTPHSPSAAAAPASRRAQADARRETVAVTYPLEQTVNLTFRGTTRLPRLSATAKVKRTGRRNTRVEMEIKNLPRAFELGEVFTTYVLWAISPEGRSDNLGEIKRGGLDGNAKIDVTTPLQTFALIVTAEPHFLVRSPSRIVVLENLPPRDPGDAQVATVTVQYLGNTSDYYASAPLPDRGPLDTAPVALLGARRAIDIARYAGAGRDAAAEFEEAKAALEQAESAWRLKRDESEVDTLARRAISLGVKAEETAEALASARKRREEIAVRDNAIREAEISAAQAAEQIAELRAALEKSERARELAEGDAANSAQVLRDLEREGKEVLNRRKSAIAMLKKPIFDRTAATLLDELMTVERYPTIEAPAEVRPQVVFSVQVSLTEELQTADVKITSGPKTPEGKVEAPLPSKPPEGRWDIEVGLSSGGFDIVGDAGGRPGGSNLAVIKLPLEGDSTSAMFKLRARPGVAARETHKVFATFWHKGQFIAKAFREVTVVRDDSAARNAVEREEALAKDESARQREERAAEKDAEEKSRRETLTARAEKAREAPSPAASRFTSGEGIAPGTLRDDARRTRPKLGSFLAASSARADTKSQGAAVFSGLDKTADLTVYMFSVGSGAGSLGISGRHLQLTQHSYTQPADTAAWLETYYRRLVQSRTRDANSADGGAVTERELTRDLLRDFGRELYLKYAPPAFKEAFWKLVDRPERDFKTIQIYSDDPTLPWELMIPVRPNGRDERGPLGVEFNVSRWHVTHNTSIPDRPPAELYLDGLVALAPAYKDGRELKHQAEELKMLQAHGFEPVSARVGDVKTLARLLPQGIIHFAGHGNIGEPVNGVAPFSISLEDGDLDPETWRGMVLDRERAHPVFFFNACSVGRTQKVANFVTGWAPAVLEAGASGFIGALWPVDDAGAAAFSQQFYDNLAAALERGPTTLGDVLKETRRNFIKNGDPTYLAYVLYGDANLTVWGY